LQHQAAPLEDWVEQRADATAAFAVLGDWNRDLDAEVAGNFPARSDGSDPAGPIDPSTVINLFPEINDGTPPESASSLAKVDRAAAAGGICHDILDQFVISNSLKAILNSSLDEAGLHARLIRGPDGASDHCALEAVLSFKH
jgi:hypothetical protein